jgi:hypothetical protein
MLYVFGDSFTDFYPNRQSINWSQLLSEKLDTPLINLGLVGCTNSHIIRTLLTEIKNIEEDDYVVIQISGPGRMDIPISENEYRTVYASDMGKYNEEIKKNKNYVWDLSDWKVIEDYFLSFHTLGFNYKDDLDNIVRITNLIYKRITKNVIIWNICSVGGSVDSVFNDDIDKQYDIKKYKSDLWLDDPQFGWIERIDKENKSIYKETNKKIVDYHLSEEGHIWMSQLMIKKFNNEINNNI